MKERLTDAELIALAALVQGNAAAAMAANAQRAVAGHSPAYGEEWEPMGVAELEAELKERGVI